MEEEEEKEKTLFLEDNNIFIYIFSFRFQTFYANVDRATVSEEQFKSMLSKSQGDQWT